MDTLTLRELWAETAEALSSKHEARWLCEVATSLAGSEFDAALDEPVTERMVAHLHSMLARYRSGEPLQYVLGRWAFRHLDLAVDRRVLIPRPETELVAEIAIEFVRKALPPRLAADLGTGSGAIGLSLATELPVDGTTIWITDVSADALDVARANLAGIGRSAQNVIAVQGSWFDALPVDLRFDVIVSNPPYVADGSVELAASVLEWEPTGALLSGSDGLDDLRHLIAEAPVHLVDGGFLVLEIGADQGDAVRSLMGRAGFVDIEIRQDLADHDRIAVGRSGRGTMSPPGRPVQ
jgi:release factor glutamine methyltransferase